MKCLVAKRITTLRCDYKQLLSKLMNKEALLSFAAPDVLLACDVLLCEAPVAI